MMRQGKDQYRLLHEIGVIDFVIVEMNEYLDTHPTDKEAMEYISHYVHMKNQAMMEYASAFEPLRIDNMDSCKHNEWKWATTPWPWERGC